MRCMVCDAPIFEEESYFRVEYPEHDLTMVVCQCCQEKEVYRAPDVVVHMVVPQISN
jgi:hypothetical protein